MSNSKFTHRLLLISLALGAAVAVVLQSIGASAAAGGPSAQGPAPGAQGSASAPGGQELTSGEVGSIALRYAAAAGDPSPTDVTSSEATFATAQAALEPGAPALSPTAAPAAGTAPSAAAAAAAGAATESWLDSPADLVLMHGHFSVNLPVPRGDAPPSGSVYALILDARTGFPEGRYVGDHTPDTRALGATRQIVSAGVSLAEASMVRRAPVRSEIIGRARHATARVGGQPGLPGRGWRIVAVAAAPSGGSKTVLASAITGRGGNFAMRIKPGSYLVEAHLPGGLRCLSPVRVQVRPSRKSYVEVGCSLP